MDNSINSALSAGLQSSLSRALGSRAKDAPISARTGRTDFGALLAQIQQTQTRERISAKLPDSVKQTPGEVDALWKRAELRAGGSGVTTPPPPLGGSGRSSSWDFLLSPTRGSIDTSLGPKLISDPNSAEGLWQKAQMMQLAQGFGPGDAMLKQLGDEDAARHNRRSGQGGSPNLFGLFSHNTASRPFGF